MPCTLASGYIYPTVAQQIIVQLKLPTPVEIQPPLTMSIPIEPPVEWLKNRFIRIFTEPDFEYEFNFAFADHVEVKINTHNATRDELHNKLKELASIYQSDSLQFPSSLQGQTVEVMTISNLLSCRSYQLIAIINDRCIIEPRSWIGSELQSQRD